MTEQIRLSPSGKPIENAGGGPLTFGEGARLRLTEGQIPMGGSTKILGTALASSAISEDGFGVPATTNPFVLDFINPKPNLNYRACMSLELINADPSAFGRVLLFVDVSVDGGTVWNNAAVSSWAVYANSITSGETTIVGNQVTALAMLTLTPGSVLGVTALTGALKFRVRAQMVTGNDVDVFSEAANGETALTGSIHFWAEECF